MEVVSFLCHVPSREQLLSFREKKGGVGGILVLFAYLLGGKSTPTRSFESPGDCVERGYMAGNPGSERETEG